MCNIWEIWNNLQTLLSLNELCPAVSAAPRTRHICAVLCPCFCFKSWPPAPGWKQLNDAHSHDESLEHISFCAFQHQLLNSSREEAARIHNSPARSTDTISRFGCHAAIFYFCTHTIQINMSAVQVIVRKVDANHERKPQQIYQVSTWMYAPVPLQQEPKTPAVSTQRTGLWVSSKLRTNNQLLTVWGGCECLPQKAKQLKVSSALSHHCSVTIHQTWWRRRHKGQNQHRVTTVSSPHGAEKSDPASSFPSKQVNCWPSYLKHNMHVYIEDVRLNDSPPIWVCMGIRGGCYMYPCKV